MDIWFAIACVGTIERPAALPNVGHQTSSQSEAPIYLQRSVDIRTVGRELGVHSVLEGSIRRPDAISRCGSAGRCP